MDISMESQDDPSEADPSLHNPFPSIENEHLPKLRDEPLFQVPQPPTPLLQSTPQKVLQAHLDPSFTMSPSKMGETSMEVSPYVKKKFDRRKLKLDLPTAKDSTDSLGNRQLNEQNNGELNPSPDELHPKQLFNAASPVSPSSESKAMLDGIDVSHLAGDNEEDFLKRQSSKTMRRCHSLDMRKHLLDMSNTPPSAYKRGVFKRPIDADFKQLKFTKKQPTERTQFPLTAGCDRLEHTDKQTVSSSLCDDTNHTTYQERIKVAVDALQSPDLIADGTRAYCLPVITGKHSDLKNINHDTMADLLRNKFKGLFDKLTVIDCRYPYEYDGGHIKDAVNIYTEEDMVEFLKKAVDEMKKSAHKHILIFHCEFSSQRGPGLLRHLRKSDRQLNILHYPQLTFPEVYCLFGGYKEFFLNYPELCEPSAYIPMIDEKYASDLRQFRIKAKSWTAGEKFKLKN